MAANLDTELSLQRRVAEAELPASEVAQWLSDFRLLVAQHGLTLTGQGVRRAWAWYQAGRLDNRDAQRKAEVQERRAWPRNYESEA